MQFTFKDLLNVICIFLINTAVFYGKAVAIITVVAFIHVDFSLTVSVEDSSYSRKPCC